MVENKQALRITFERVRTSYVFRTADYGIAKVGPAGAGFGKWTPRSPSTFSHRLYRKGEGVGAAYGSLDVSKFALLCPECGAVVGKVDDKDGEELREEYATLRFTLTSVRGAAAKKRGEIPSRGDVRNFRIIWKEVFGEWPVLVKKPFLRVS